MSATKKMWIERFSNAFNKLKPTWDLKWFDNLNGGSIFTAFITLNAILVFGLAFDVDPIIYYVSTIGNLCLLVFVLYILMFKSRPLYGTDILSNFLLGVILCVLAYGWCVVQWVGIPLPQTYLEESVADECYASVMAETTKDAHTHISMFHHMYAKRKCLFGDKNQSSPRLTSQQEIIQSAISQHSK